MPKVLPAQDILKMVLDEPVITSSESDMESDDDLQTAAVAASSGTESYSLSNSEDDEDDSAEAQSYPNELFAAKDGTVWSNQPPAKSQTRAHNVMKVPPGPSKGVSTATPKSAFELFITDLILDEILMCTNREGNRIALAKNKVWRKVDKDELLAYMGILLLAGKERSWDVPTRELFFSKYSNPMYRATMSESRFQDLTRVLRFDDKRTRADRLKTDHMAAFRHVWDLFIKNCRRSLIPSENLTIDEQLVGFRGRCKFTQYMPNKPAKYGIKIFWLCDADSAYALDGLVYLGRQPGEPVATNLSANIVKTLAQTVQGSGRNITMDNYFTSRSVGLDLLRIKITVVGTMKHNRREIPQVIKDVSDRDVHSSRFCFTEDATLVSYVPKKKKNVILLSTMHHDCTVDADHMKRKPEMISFYNSTKGGVDQMDQMVKTYTCKRQTRRWPMVLFSNVIDVAALNAYIVFCKQHPDYHGSVTHKRRLFLQHLVEDLVNPQIAKRSQAKNLPRDTIAAMRACGVGVTDDEAVEAQPSKKRKRCAYCDRKNDKKTSTMCKCGKAVCPQHCVVVCKECARDYQ